MRVSTALPWLAFAGAVGYITWQHAWPEHSMSPAITPLPQEYALPADTAASGPVSYAPAVRRAAPAVVSVYGKQKQDRHNPLSDIGLPHLPAQASREQTASLGSGVIVSPDGYVLTNDHVVLQADRIVVALRDGRKVDARVIGTDPDTDLAVLKIQLDKLPVLPFRTTPSAVGDVVLAIGNPFGVGQTVTQGIISAIGRSGLGISTYEDFIQTDAAINPGNSGGALVDVSGNLVGINSAIYSRSGGNLGIGFAIPAPLAKQVMESIIAQGHVVRGWLGVEIAGRTALGDGQPDDGNNTVVVADVMSGGPGAKGGLRNGDILIKVDGTAVTSPSQVVRQIGALKPGQQVEVVVQRGDSPQTLRVTMGERPKQRGKPE